MPYHSIEDSTELRRVLEAVLLIERDLDSLRKNTDQSVMPHERDGLDEKLKSAAAIALGDFRHLVKIDWDQPPKPS
jgi:hypothetical protein